jgi:predicted nucleic acid-binding protein
VILADTSVWVDHLRRGNASLAASLERGGVATHPYVIGELACGSMRARHQILEMLGGLPSVHELSHAEAMHFLETHRLQARGLGWIDVHLLAAAVLADVPLFTLDARLAAEYEKVARR